MKFFDLFITFIITAILYMAINWYIVNPNKFVYLILGYVIGTIICSFKEEK